MELNTVKAKTLTIAMLIVMLCGACSAKPAEPPAKPVAAASIVADYEANKDNADAAYKGKIVRITGRAGNTGDVFGTPFVLLRDTDSGNGLMCYFDHHQDEAKTVQKGQQVTVQGKIRGGDTYVVDDCSLA